MAIQNDEKLNSKIKNNDTKTKIDQQDDSNSTINNNKKLKSDNKSIIKEEDKKDDKIKEEKDQENEDKEEDDESLKDEEEGNSNALNANVGKKSFLGHTCSVKTLIDDKVLVPENNALSFEFMGKTFYADLLPNGGIRWTENKQTFSTPSSWVNFCKRTMTSDYINKSVSAWSTIKYDGKRLDSYKLRWYRKQKKNFQGSPFQNYSNLANLNQVPTDSSIYFDTSNKTNSDLLESNINNKESLMSDIYFDDDPELDKKRNLVKHCDLPLKHLITSTEPIRLRSNQLVKTESFSSIDRVQPFTVTISTHALLLIDFHCHLTTEEVVGYLAGTWDSSSLNLNILQAFPCRSKIDDDLKSKKVQDEVIQNIRQRNLSLIGWYHNHYNRAAQPTVKDIECQLQYQLTMCENEIQYLPCVGLICSPYDKFNKENCSSLIAYWVLPPLNLLEYGKPLHLFYQTSRDSFLTQDLLLEMRLLAHFYMDCEDKINFNEIYKDAKPNKDESITTYWDKLKYSIKPNLPSDLQVSDDLTVHQSNLQQQALVQFYTFLKGLLIRSQPSSTQPSSTQPSTQPSSTQPSTQPSSTQPSTQPSSTQPSSTQPSNTTPTITNSTETVSTN